MTRFIDTTLRLLCQDPLARTLSTATVLRLAERLDEVGYSALEVSGGGCFTTAVERGLESPWECIRAVRGRTRTPLAMAVRGGVGDRRVPHARPAQRHRRPRRPGGRRARGGCAALRGTRLLRRARGPRLPPRA